MSGMNLNGRVATLGIVKSDAKRLWVDHRVLKEDVGFFTAVSDISFRNSRHIDFYEISSRVGWLDAEYTRATHISQ